MSQTENVVYVDGYCYLVEQDQREKVCNYFPRVLRVARKGDDLRPANVVVRFELEVQGVRTKVYEYTLAELRTMDLTQLDYRCQNYMDSAKQCAEIVYTIIYEQVEKYDLTSKSYFQHTGWSQLRGKTVYVAGRDLIGEDGFVGKEAFAVSSELTGMRLDIDLNLSEADAIKGLTTIWAANQAVSLCAACYEIYSLLRPLYLEAGWKRAFTCYLVGPSQSRKTSFAKLLVQVFNCKDSEPRPKDISLLSTRSAILADLERFPDVCRLVDDLYEGSSKASAKQREETVSELIRLIGNDTSRDSVCGKEQVSRSIPCGVVCTAEYLPKGYSTLVRCLILQVKEPFRSDALTRLQNSPLIWPTFLYYFLAWCVRNKSGLVERIAKRHAKYQLWRGEHPVPEEGLREMQLLLETALSILIKYLHSFRKADECIRIKQTGKWYIESVIQEQEELISRLRNEVAANQVPRAVAELYEAGCFEITKKPKRKFQEGLAAVEHKGCLCMKPDYLVGLLQKHLSNPDLTVKEVTSALRKDGLLSMDKSNRSTKKLNGVRALQIRIDYLCQLYGAEDIFADIL